MHIPSLGSRQISDQMSLFLCRKNPQAALPQHGGYQDENQQRNRWNISSEDRSICPCFVRIFSLAAGDWSFPSVFDPLTCLFFFFFVVLKCICYCYAPKFVYRQRGNTPYIWSQEFIISRVGILAVCSKSHYQPRFSYYRKQQLFLGTKNFSANNKPVKIALPMFHPISWHYGPLPLLLGAPWSVLSLRGEAAAAGHQHLESFARRTIMFMVVVLSPRSTWVHFNMFANLFYTFPLPPLFCRSTSHLNLLCTADFKYARWYFSAAFVKPKTSFVQLQVCVSLTDRRRVLHCEVSSAKPVPHLFSPHASIPLLWRSQGLGHRTSPMFLYAALRC